MSNVVTRALAGIWARATGAQPRTQRAQDEHFGGVGGLPGVGGKEWSPSFRHQRPSDPPGRDRDR